MSSVLRYERSSKFAADYHAIPARARVEIEHTASRLVVCLFGNHGESAVKKRCQVSSWLRKQHHEALCARLQFFAQKHKSVDRGLHLGAISVGTCPLFHFSFSCLMLTWSALINVRMVRGIAKEVDFCAGASMDFICRDFDFRATLVLESCARFQAKLTLLDPRQNLGNPDRCFECPAGILRQHLRRHALS